MERLGARDLPWVMLSERRVRWMGMIFWVMVRKNVWLRPQDGTNSNPTVYRLIHQVGYGAVASA